MNLTIDKRNSELVLQRIAAEPDRAAEILAQYEQDMVPDATDAIEGLRAAVYQSINHWSSEFTREYDGVLMTMGDGDYTDWNDITFTLHNLKTDKIYDIRIEFGPVAITEQAGDR